MVCEASPTADGDTVMAEIPQSAGRPGKDRLFPQTLCQGHRQRLTRQVAGTDETAKFEEQSTRDHRVKRLSEASCEVSAKREQSVKLVECRVKSLPGWGVTLVWSSGVESLWTV